jgi:hypothetical protein
MEVVCFIDPCQVLCVAKHKTKVKPSLALSRLGPFTFQPSVHINASRLTEVRQKRCGTPTVFKKQQSGYITFDKVIFRANYFA